MFAQATRLSSVASLLRISRISSHILRQHRSMTTLKLNTGASIPAVGFGTVSMQTSPYPTLSQAQKCTHWYLGLSQSCSFCSFPEVLKVQMLTGHWYSGKVRTFFSSYNILGNLSLSPRPNSSIIISKSTDANCISKR
jgi:hypothetical protein